MNPVRRHRTRRLAAIMTALLVLPVALSPVGAWSNYGDNYGTHDWILDQAMKLLDKRGINIAWINRSVALLATDDADTVEKAADPSREIEHVYTGGGKRGGAVHRITEHYAAMQRLYEEGRAAQLAGDDTTANKRYDSASYQLGMLAHFYGDVLVPYHTSRDAIGQDTKHKAYELLVDDLTRRSTYSPEWSVANTSWVVEDVTNVRTAAIAAAAYSRARYTTLAANFDADDTSLSGPADQVTKEVLIRASGDLADLIVSAKKGIGNPPPVGSIKPYMKWRGVKPNELTQAAHAVVLDVNGNPIEGVQVDVSWPKPDGTKLKLRFWTDETGHGHITNRVWDTASMAKQTVTESVTTNLTTVSKTTWWYETRRLADSTTGFLSTMNDRTVQAGQTVTVSSRAKDTKGNPIVGLYVEWTWQIGSTTKVTSGYTNSSGIAKSTYTVTSSTPKSTIYVTGRTSAYSINRSSKTSFYRTD